MPDSKRRIRTISTYLGVLTIAMAALLPTSSLVAQEEVDGGQIEQGDEGFDGSNITDTAGRSGGPGKPGNRGLGSRDVGQVVRSDPSPTPSQRATGTGTTRKSTATSSKKPPPSETIPLILLLPLPSPTAAEETAGATLESAEEAEVSLTTDPKPETAAAAPELDVAEPAQQKSSPLAKFVAIVAAIVVVGSVIALMRQRRPAPKHLRV